MDTITSDEQEKRIYENYQTIIAPLIVELEARDLEFPVELLNEIRSIFTHISRYKINNERKELYSAERHVKRAVLDCFKYLCVSRANEIKQFREEYRWVDLSVADNGKFLSKLNRMETEARTYYIQAKKMENIMGEDDDKLYEAYQKAHNYYSTLTKFKDESHESILFACNHAKKKDLLNIIGIIVTAISIIFGILGMSNLI